MLEESDPQKRLGNPTPVDPPCGVPPKSEAPVESALLEQGVRLKKRWIVGDRIGNGAFGQVYVATDGNCRVAVKAEPCAADKQVLKMEVAVLKALNAGNKTQGICTFHGCGRHGGCNYILMQLCGENLSQVRRSTPANSFPPSVAAKIAIQMLRTIRCVHDAGFLHRDVKPSNFARADNVSGEIYILDFGLSRRHISEESSVPGVASPSGPSDSGLESEQQKPLVRTARASCGFRGTARYASLNAHANLDLGRRDDLWSLFYCTIEAIAGQLPWRRLKDKVEVAKAKQATTMEDLLEGLPSQLDAFAAHLEELAYEDMPDYDLLEQLLVDIVTDHGSVADLAHLRRNNGHIDNQLLHSWPAELILGARHSQQLIQSKTRTLVPRTASRDDNSPPKKTRTPPTSILSRPNPLRVNTTFTRTPPRSAQGSPSVSPRAAITAAAAATSGTDLDRAPARSQHDQLPSSRRVSIDENPIFSSESAALQPQQQQQHPKNRSTRLHHTMPSVENLQALQLSDLSEVLPDPSPHSIQPHPPAAATPAYHSRITTSLRRRRFYSPSPVME